MAVRTLWIESVPPNCIRSLSAGAELQFPAGADAASRSVTIPKVTIFCTYCVAVWGSCCSKVDILIPLMTFNVSKSTFTNVVVRFWDFSSARSGRGTAAAPGAGTTSTTGARSATDVGGWIAEAAEHALQFF